jgi:serine/threonine protein kinase
VSDLPAFDDSVEEATEVVGSMAPGSFFGDRFRLEGSLGAGAMGAVFHATDLRHDEHPVALKVMLKSSKDAEARQRFEREYKALSAIKHIGIVDIYGFGYDASRRMPWLAMEKLDGETLRGCIKRKGALEPRRVALIVGNVADALEAAHAKGVIHRDLKPDHIFLIGKSGKVKIIDFGLSLVRDSKKLTATGTVIGTPRYMAPEQIASAHAATEAADVYALGVVAYEALVGDSPFVASDQGQLLGAILAGRRKPLLEARPELSQELEDVLNKAMAPLVADRYQTPGEFASAFMTATGLSPKRRRQRSKLSPGSIGAPKNYYLWLAFGAVMSAVLSAALTYWLTRG